ncbi:MAG TPA: sugar ABC transporter permease [Candidatus Dormibacteraeota bacterium]
MSTMVDDPRLALERGGWAGLVRLGLRRLRQGELGPVPVIVGLVVIAAVFQLQNPNYLTALNLTNLLQQIVPVGVLAVGVVPVLLLGEIDLSIGPLSGFCGGVLAVLSVNHGVPGPVAVLAALAVGAVVGLCIGLIRTKLQVPSFIVSLAGFIGFQGALLYVLGTSGTINLNDSFILALMNRLLPVWLGWVVGLAFVAAYALGGLWNRRRRLRAGLLVPPISLFAVRQAVIALPVLAVVGLMSTNRGRGVIPVSGVPLGVVILLGLVVLFDVICGRTTFGRHLYATGGNAEAAKRAGIPVDRIRVVVFVLSSTLAACGGVLAASRLFAVNQGSGGGNFTLDAIACAVIGGTSLFGGRGSVWSALLGALVIGSIANGMDLLALPSSVKFMIEGGVLLVAVTIDAVSRRGRQAAGRV